MSVELPRILYELKIALTQITGRSPKIEIAVDHGTLCAIDREMQKHMAAIDQNLKLTQRAICGIEIKLLTKDWPPA